MGILVHEWLEPRGGSENVFEELSRIFPNAPRFALWNDSGGRFTGVRETFLARTPLRRKKALALPVMPIAWRTLPSAEADWVLVSSHLFAHHAKFRGPAADAPKYVYAHTPARYIWVPELDGRGGSIPARLVSSALKPLDRKRAREPEAIAANSKFVADRISATWGREAQVIYPPVDVNVFAQRSELCGDDQRVMDAIPDQFLFGVSRFVPYKQLDQVIRAGVAAKLPVVLAGSGPDEARLRAMADQLHPGQVSFVLAPSFNLLRSLYRAATAVVFAPIEDFGIIPVEAMASGTPVIANAVGGAAESVLDGVTGAHVKDWMDYREVATAVDRATRANQQDLATRAADFAPEIFGNAIRAFVSSKQGQ